jgi:hypothetical protein
MDENEMDDTLSSAEDRTFYRDSFGEKIIREGDEEPTMADADDDEDMVPDEADEEMEPAVPAGADEDFLETLDEEAPKDEEPASIDKPDSDSKADDLP